MDRTAPAVAPFVVGVPRSGTTLLRLMLDAHSRLAIPPETHFIPRFAAAWRSGAQPLDASLRVLGRHGNWPDLGLDLEEIGGELRRARPAGAGDALRLIYRAYAERRGKERWGDKTPRYSEVMPLIRSLLPEARFVHVIRDGRDVALSLRKTWFGPKTMTEAAQYWAGRMERAHADGEALGGYLEVRYERLATEPVPELRRICEFLELEWEPAMLAYYEDADERLAEEERNLVTRDGVVAAEERAGLHRRLRTPPDAVSIGRWREEMSEGELGEFLAVAEPELRALGYLEDAGPPSLP